MTKKKSYCCGCCSDADDENVVQNSKVHTSAQGAIELQPLGNKQADQNISASSLQKKVESIFYWEGFRAVEETIQPKSLKINIPTKIKQSMKTIIFLQEIKNVIDFPYSPS